MFRVSLFRVSLVGRRLQLATMTAVCALTGAAAAQDMPAAVLTAPGPQAAAVPPAPAPEPTAPASGPAAPAANPFSQGQLEQLVAPIALYPDPLLSQVLMASTYPLEVVEADRWVRDPANQALHGEALTQALQAQNWDPSVKALVPFPRLLALIADRLEWTQQLGDAFLAQQADVMNAIQTLRHAALVAGNLTATPQCHCVIRTSGEIISILPADTELVCIPVYNPRVAYGAWPVPEYPPYFFPVPIGFAFEPGFAVGFYPGVELAAFGAFWGWASIDWGHRDIGIDRSRYAAIDSHSAFSGSSWVHDPAHRGGVAYRDSAVTARFGAARLAAVAAAGHAAPVRAAGAPLGAGAAGGFGGARSAARIGGAAPGAGHVAARPSHAEVAYHHGSVGRGGPATVHGSGGHAIARAQFSPRGGAPHFAAPAGSSHGGGGHGGGGTGGGGGRGGAHHR